MGKVYERIDENIREWIARQQMFFVATAPLTASGHVNVSPKGHDTLRVLDDHTLAYMDYGGSGIETVAHVRENSRITIMMCAFEGQAKIFRFYGTGEVFTPLDEGYSTLSEHFDQSELGVRAIIKIHVTRVSDSCGYGVPLYEFQEQRRISPHHVKKRGIENVRDYLKENNQKSIDGLEGISGDEAMAFQGPDGG